jgi:hypothetical protein
MHYRDGTSTAAVSSTKLQALANAVKPAFTANLSPNVASNVSFTSITAVDIGSATGASAIGTGTPFSGGGGSPLEPSSMCSNVAYKIAARYRGGHPRGFWPVGNPAQLLNESNWNPTQLSLNQTAINNFLAAIESTANGAGWSACTQTIPRWTYTVTNDPVKQKYFRHRTGFSHFDDVLLAVISPVVGQQRRRLRL